MRIHLFLQNNNIALHRNVRFDRFWNKTSKGCCRIGVDSPGLMKSFTSDPKSHRQHIFNKRILEVCTNRNKLKYEAATCHLKHLR